MYYSLDGLYEENYETWLGIIKNRFYRGLRGIKWRYVI